MIGQTILINNVPREVIGVMPPGADVMDNRTEVWMPLGLNPANRQNRGSHFLYLIGRLRRRRHAAGRAHRARRADSELGRADRREEPRLRCRSRKTSGHILQMKPMREEILGEASQAIWVLQVAVGFVLLIACANLANLLLARAEARHREFAVRTALGAGRGRLLRQFMTEGVILSIAGGALGLLLAHRRRAARCCGRIRTSLPRTSEVAVDARVLVFTFAVSIATGVGFRTRADPAHPHERADHRAQGGRRAWCDAHGASSHSPRSRDGRGRAGGDARHRRGPVAAHGVQPHHRRRRLRSIASRHVFDDAARFATTRSRPRARRCTSACSRSLRAVPGVQAATAMSGLPPNRPLNANDTDIDNYTAPPEGPFENVDYYQYVMSDYFETMGIPIVQGRSFQPRRRRLDRAWWRSSTKRSSTRSGKGVTRSDCGCGPCCGDQVPWFTVVGVAKDVKQGGVDQKTGTEFYFFVDQTSASRRRSPSRRRR